MTQGLQKTRILVAEDSSIDCLLLQRAFERVGLSVELNFVSDGQAAIDFLSHEGDYKELPDNPVPDVLLLDLKMPRLDGFDVLDWLRDQPVLSRVPVVVLTSSDDPGDIDRAYDLGANSYLLKPSRSEKLDDLVRQIQTYWAEWNVSPQKTHG